MTAHSSPDNFARKHVVPIEELIAIALPRLRRQKQYARVIDRGGKAKVGLEGWFDQASRCLRELAYPRILLQPLTARLKDDRATFSDAVELSNERLVAEIRAGGQITAYLLTLSFSQAHAFEVLSKDYAAHHVQTDLASEALFALGRIAFRLQLAAASGRHLRRIPIQCTELCGQKSLWDPEQVQALLTCFTFENPGVTVTDTGCFEPLHSLIGLTVSH